MANIKFSGKVHKADTRYMPDGKACLNFNVYSYAGKDKEGNYKPSTWTRVTAWGELAEQWMDKLEEKQSVTVTGVFSENRVWKRNDGTNSAELCVTAYEIDLGDAFKVETRKYEPAGPDIGDGENMPF
ncbi:MAG: single-stranded DNA-binding protein [Candidatus Paceibacterota bacterium]|jgi:single-stranded DNA-binding protein